VLNTPMFSTAQDQHGIFNQRQNMGRIHNHWHLQGKRILLTHITVIRS